MYLQYHSIDTVVAVDNYKGIFTEQTEPDTNLFIHLHLWPLEDAFV